LTSLNHPIAVAALAIVVRLVPAALAFGTSDVMAWQLLGQLLLNGENFYATQLHNWPVLWIYFAGGALLAHDATGLPFSTLVKIPPIVADAGIAALLCRAGMRSSWSTTAGVIYALHPVSILITGYHGQFDSLMLAPTFLAWHIWQTWRGPKRLIGSGLALGLGVWFKPVPLLLLPVLLPRLATWRERAVYTFLALAPAALGTLPYFVLWPQDVAANFFGYSSWFGQWGYPVVWMVVEFVRNGTIPWWLPDPDHVSRALQWMYAAGRWVLVAALATTWWLTYRRGLDVLRSIVATFAAFYFATSGFGVQYLLWIVPFAIAARDRWLWPFSVTATGLLLVAYTLGLAYVPIEPIPDNGPDMREFVVKIASLPAWVVTGLWAWSAVRRRSA
jgi:hypothetical protein